MIKIFIKYFKNTQIYFRINIVYGETTPIQCSKCYLYSTNKTPDYPNCFALETENSTYLETCALGQVCQTMFTFKKVDSDNHFSDGFKGKLFLDFAFCVQGWI